MTAIHRRNVVLDPADEGDFVRLAQANDRSFSAELRRAMREYLARHDSSRQPGNARRKSEAAASNGDSAKTTVTPVRRAEP